MRRALPTLNFAEAEPGVSKELTCWGVSTTKVSQRQAPCCNTTPSTKVRAMLLMRSSNPAWATVHDAGHTRCWANRGQRAAAGRPARLAAHKPPGLPRPNPALLRSTGKRPGQLKGLPRRFSASKTRRARAPAPAGPPAAPTPRDVPHTRHIMKEAVWWHKEAEYDAQVTAIKWVRHGAHCVA